MVPVLALGLGSDTAEQYSPAPISHTYEIERPTSLTFEEALRNIVNEPAGDLETAITIDKREGSRGIFLHLDGEEIPVGPGFMKNLGE